MLIACSSRAARAHVRAALILSSSSRLLAARVDAGRLQLSCCSLAHSSGSHYFAVVSAAARTVRVRCFPTSLRPTIGWVVCSTQLMSACTLPPCGLTPAPCSRARLIYTPCLRGWLTNAPRSWAWLAMHHALKCDSLWRLALGLGSPCIMLSSLIHNRAWHLPRSLDTPTFMVGSCAIWRDRVVVDLPHSPR